MIPFKRRDKSFRACYRYYKYDSALTDCSYFNYLLFDIKIIKNDDYNNDIEMTIINDYEDLKFNYIIKFLNIFIEKSSLNTDMNYLFKEKNETLKKQNFNYKKFDADIINYIKGNLIGPIEIIFLEKNLLFKFNPLIANEILDNLINFQKEFTSIFTQKNFSLEFFYSKSLNNFKIIGPRSGSKIFKILNSLGGFDEILYNNNIDNIKSKENLYYFFNRIQEEENFFENFLNEIPNNTVMIFKIKSPDVKFKMTEFSFKNIYEILIKSKNDDKEKSLIYNDMYKNNINNNNIKEVKNIFLNHTKIFNIFQDNIKDSDFIKLSDLIKIFLEEEKEKENNIYNDNTYNNISANNTNDNYLKFSAYLQQAKNKDINITQKKLMLRKFKTILNTYTERGTIVHRRKLKLEDLNEKVEESLSIEKHKILNYFTMQKKSEKNLNGKILNKIVNNTITENLNNYNINDIKKILESDKEKNNFVILIKSSILNKDFEKEILHETPFYDFIFPSGYASDILRRFSYFSTKIIGLKEMNYFFNENYGRIFPDDYPDTNAYRDYIKQKAIKKIEKYCLYPPSKRINYQKIKIAFPFYPNWDLLKDLKYKYKKNNSSENNLNNDIDNDNKEYFNNFNFEYFNENTLVIKDIQNKQNLKNQLNIQIIKNPLQRNLLIPINFKLIGKGKPIYNANFSLLDILEYEKIHKLLNFKILEKNSEKNKYNNNNNYNNIIDLSRHFILNLLDNPEKKDIIFEYENNKKLKNSIVEHPEKIKNLNAKNKEFNSEFKIYKDLYEKKAIDKVRFSSNILDYNFNIKINFDEISRDVIGFCTNGQYSYCNHKGIGKGFITLNKFEEILQMKKIIQNKLNENLTVNNNNNYNLKMFNLILMRNPDSKNYNIAKINYRINY